ncbi:MAG: hypothetical protein PHS37_01945, partial [Candidatus Omnitrophica bacterium]|nr:hypothetical protein [Candidatus Omnitrophota bacterium]
MKRPPRVVTLITLTAFVLTMGGGDVPLGKAWAAQPGELTGVGASRSGQPGSVLKVLDPDTFLLAPNLGSIKYKWSPVSSIPRRGLPLNKGLARDELRPKVVIHIQDAHCNYFAQQKINEIIGYLRKQYGAGTVNLEGGAGPYDLSVFTNITDRKKRDNVSDYFLKEGLVNGAEYNAIKDPGQVSLWGIEDAALYLENLGVYRGSLKHKDEAGRLTASISYLLEILKNHIYSEALLDLDKKFNAYKVNKLPLKEYLDYLVRKAEDKAIAIKTLANVYLLNQALRMEPEIDFAKANAEREVLVDELGKRLSKNALNELVAKTVDFKAEKVRQTDFYEFLSTKAAAVRLDLAKFSNLKNYIVYVALYEAVDKTEVMAEITELEEKIKDVLWQNEVQKELDRLSRHFALTQNLFNVTLTRDDYRYYKTHEEQFAVRNYREFVDRQAPLYKITARLPDNAGDLDSYREDMNRFYECSFSRDEAFLRNIKFDESQIAVIVTGGFHTENLCELFKKNNIAYVSIMPNFKSEEGYECPYFKILGGTNQILDKRILASAGFSLAVPDLWNRLGITAEGETAKHQVEFAVWLKRMFEEDESVRRLVLTGPGGSVVVDADFKVIDGLPADVVAALPHQPIGERFVTKKQASFAVTSPGQEAEIEGAATAGIRGDVNSLLLGAIKHAFKQTGAIIEESGAGIAVIVSKGEMEILDHYLKKRKLRERLIGAGLNTMLTIALAIRARRLASVIAGWIEDRRDIGRAEKILRLRDIVDTNLIRPAEIAYYPGMGYDVMTAIRGLNADITVGVDPMEVSGDSDEEIMRRYRTGILASG